MTPLPTLKARLESATEPDRELDCAVALTFDQGWTVNEEHDELDFQPPPYTASVDAALELVSHECSGDAWLYLKKGSAIAQNWQYDKGMAFLTALPIAIVFVFVCDEPRRARVSALEGEKK